MELINISNQQTYEAEDVVQSYSLGEKLQEPEKRILNVLEDKLKDAKMLDIGVGGGRTTIHFAPLVKQYIGIDYSENMIKTCKKRFPHIQGFFKKCDASSMAIFENNYFDFILFSFNGIDYVSHEDRLKVLKEIRRVGKNGGYFCFSSHNLNTDIENSFNIKFTNNPVKLLYRIYNYLLFKFLTKNFKKQQKAAKHLIINDGAHKFRSKTYYIKPEEQINQLTALGFRDIKVYSLSDGKEIADEYVLNTAKDSWLYYLCRT